MPKEAYLKHGTELGRTTFEQTGGVERESDGVTEKRK